MRAPVTTAWNILAGLLFALALAVHPACSRKERTIEAGPRIVQAAELTEAFGVVYTGDVTYSQVASATLPGYYETFRAALFAEGVTKWDGRFDCNHFASYYVAKAQAAYYLATFHSRTPAQTLALGTYWYRPGGAGAGHAIVAALTERGPVYIEPQTGAELRLTPAEQASAWLKVF